jgi:glutamyl-tRNA reductase
VRAETGLGAAPDAFVALAADLADQALGGLRDRDVVVVGAGQMAALAVKHLRRRGVGPVRILNRSLEHARALADRTNAAHGDLDALPEALAHADLVVSATGAAGVVVTREAVAREGRPLALVDLAMPRDVDPAVAELPGVTLIDIVSLRELLSDRDERTAGRDRARARDRRRGGPPVRDPPALRRPRAHHHGAARAGRRDPAGRARAGTPRISAT